MYSELVDGVIFSPNCNSPRNDSVRKITIHHMAGIMTGEQCAQYEHDNDYNSANYCIGVDGDIWCAVDEDDRAWTSSSPWNDNQAITIEVSNNGGDPDWTVSDASFESMINLCVDICKRYGFRLEYTGDENGSLTEHRMFAATDCPGPYLHDRMSFIAEEVNRRLDKKPVSVVYSAHCQDIGWMNEVSDGQIAGVVGENKRLEAFKAYSNHDGVWINYSAHVSNIGWMEYVNENEAAGTEGEGKQIEAVKMRLVGENANNFDVYYRSHVSNIGWMNWAKNDMPSGSTGLGLKIEAIQVLIVDKDSEVPNDIDDVNPDTNTVFVEQSNGYEITYNRL